MLSRSSSPAQATKVAAPAQQPQQPQPQPVSQALLGGSVERVSRGEVRVSTRPDLGNAPAIEVAYADVPAGSAAPVDEEQAAPGSIR